MKRKNNVVFGTNFEDNKCIPPVIRKVVEYFEENGKKLAFTYKKNEY